MTGRPDAPEQMVRSEAIRTLYLQLRNSAAAAGVVTIYMTVTAWTHNPPRTILIWLSLQILTQILREGLFWAYRAARPEPAGLPRWALAYTCYMTMAGSVWGSTIFLFAHPANPITVALTLCGLYGIAGGSVPGNAYNPPGLYAFVLLIFGCVLTRMSMIGDTSYTALGIASAGFAAILILFCRVQARALDDGFRMRFENRALVAELTLKNVEAEEARSAAERASLAKSQFLAAASHDLRQPLYALGLFSASLENLTLDAESRRVVTSIQDNIGALGSLFDGLLDISKLDAGVIQPDFAPVQVDELFDHLSHYFAPIAAERGLDLRWRSSSDYVWSDCAMLQQVLSNLISNSLRYTISGAILVAARQRGSSVLFEVWDTGIGIDPSDLTRIFDEFVQVGNPQRDRQKGLGLGLSIAQRSVLLLGSNQILVRSRIGKGSCFSFELPIASAKPAIAKDLSRSGDGLLGRAVSVLVVEDDTEVQQALAILLGQWGATFQIVETSLDALTACKGDAPHDLLLVDHRLPGGMSGFDLIKALRSRKEAKPSNMVLVTGDVDPDLIAEARLAAITLLHKPLSAEALQSVLAHVNRQPSR